MACRRDATSDGGLVLDRSSVLIYSSTRDAGCALDGPNQNSSHRRLSHPRQSDAARIMRLHRHVAVLSYSKKDLHPFHGLHLCVQELASKDFWRIAAVSHCSGMRATAPRLLFRPDSQWKAQGGGKEMRNHQEQNERYLTSRCETMDAASLTTTY